MLACCVRESFGEDDEEYGGFFFVLLRGEQLELLTLKSANLTFAGEWVIRIVGGVEKLLNCCA